MKISKNKKMAKRVKEISNNKNISKCQKLLIKDYQMFLFHSKFLKKKMNVH